MTIRTIETYVSEHVVYAPDTAARLARVSVEFVRQCEQGDLIPRQITVGGETGFLRAAVSDLICVRHLHEDLGLELDAVDFIMRLRRRITALDRHAQEMEQRMIGREQELLAEIRRLRGKSDAGTAASD